MLPDEVELWTHYQRERLIEHRNALVEFYLEHAHRTAAKYCMRVPQHARNLSEMAGYAADGLMQAVERFDPDRGLRFLTYAGPRMLYAILDALRANDWVPRLERTRAKTDDRKIIRQVSINRLVDAHRKCDQSINEDGLGVFDPEDTRDFWVEACRGLSKMQRLALMLHFRCGLTMKQVGKSLGVSESRISQVLSDTVKTIRANGRDLRPVKPSAT